jgi:hypothetical protein
MYLYLALECDSLILEAYSKAVYSRKQHLQPWQVQIFLHVPDVANLGTACIYLKNNQIHRTEGPAVVFDDGSYIWYLQGKRSRTNGPSTLIKNPLFREWRIGGKLHRKDGPAIEYAQTLEQLRKDKHLGPVNYSLEFWVIEFYVNGVPHRDHPHAAKITGYLGKVCVEFWNNGRKIESLYVSEYSELEPYL